MALQQSESFGVLIPHLVGPTPTQQKYIADLQLSPNSKVIDFAGTARKPKAYPLSVIPDFPGGEQRALRCLRSIDQSTLMQQLEEAEASKAEEQRIFYVTWGLGIHLALNRALRNPEIAGVIGISPILFHPEKIVPVFQEFEQLATPVFLIGSASDNQKHRMEEKLEEVQKRCLRCRTRILTFREAHHAFDHAAVPLGRFHLPNKNYHQRAHEEAVHQIRKWLENRKHPISPQ